MDQTKRDVASHLYATLDAYFARVLGHGGYSEAAISVRTNPDPLQSTIEITLPGYMGGRQYRYTVRLSGGPVPIRPTKAGE